MSVILDRDGRPVADLYPEWTDPGAPLPSHPVLLPLQRFLSEGGARKDAVLLPNTFNVATLPPPVLACPLLVLDYPAFADGRAYSQARLLSRAGHYKGQIRARGKAVVLDQLKMLKTCGFTQFELREDQNVSACASLLGLTFPR